MISINAFTCQMLQELATVKNNMLIQYIIDSETYNDKQLNLLAHISQKPLTLYQ